MNKENIQNQEHVCWSDERAEELKLLQQLLTKVAGLNHGNKFLESVRWCIETATKLYYNDSEDTELSKPSFFNHLYVDCILERERLKLQKQESNKADGN